MPFLTLTWVVARSFWNYWELVKSAAVITLWTIQTIQIYTVRAFLSCSFRTCCLLDNPTVSDRVLPLLISPSLTIAANFWWNIPWEIVLNDVPRRPFWLRNRLIVGTWRCPHPHWRVHPPGTAEARQKHRAVHFSSSYLQKNMSWPLCPHLRFHPYSCCSILILSWTVHTPILANHVPMLVTKNPYVHSHGFWVLSKLLYYCLV